MATDLSALNKAIKLVADVANDVMSGGSLASYAGIMPDVISLLPSIGDLVPEAKQLALADYESLAATLAADLVITNEKAKAIVDAAIPVLADIVSDTPHILLLIAAVKS